MLFRRRRRMARFQSQSRMRASADHQRPSCEIGLSHFCRTGKTRLLKRCQRRALGNGPMSRNERTESESLAGFYRGKSRTIGLNSESQRPRGRRLILPGWGAGIRTPEWRYQKPLPYHLATPQCREAASYAIRAAKATTGIGLVMRWFAAVHPCGGLAVSLAFSGVAPVSESRYSPASVGV